MLDQHQHLMIFGCVKSSKHARIGSWYEACFKPFGLIRNLLTHLFRGDGEGFAVSVIKSRLTKQDQQNGGTMKRFAFALCFLFLMLVVGTAMAGKPPKGQGLFITQDIDDYDDNSVAYSIQSDGLGVYKDGLSGGSGTDVSVLMSNVCNGLTYGDRLLENTATQIRKVKITLDSTNALVPGDFGYQVPAQPIGTVLSSVRFMNKCTCGANVSMYTMTANSKILCPMHLRLAGDSNGNYYRLDMGTADEPETEMVQITCNSIGSDGHCNDWNIDPVSDPDYTVNPGRTRARLNYFVNCHGRGCAPDPNHGAFYVTFHLHVTRP